MKQSNKSKTAVWHIDNLTEECGFFTSRTSVNNGYGCFHPDQTDVADEEIDDEEVTRPTCGRCFTFTCPIASELDPKEPLDAEEFIRCGMKPEEHDSGEWMLVTLDEQGRLVGAKEEASNA